MAPYAGLYRIKKVLICRMQVKKVRVRQSERAMGEDVLIQGVGQLLEQACSRRSVLWFGR